MVDERSRKRINLSRLDEWQGRPTIKQNDSITWRWDKEEERYFPVSTNPTAPDRDQKITGIYYTYFQAIGAYGKPNLTRLNYFYSTEILGRAVFRSNDNRARQGLRPSDYNGQIPFDVLNNLLNELLGTKDWKVAFREVEFSYERGAAVYYYTKSGKRTLRKFPIPSSRVSHKNFSSRRAKQIDRQRKKSRRKRVDGRQSKL